MTNKPTSIYLTEEARAAAEALIIAARKRGEDASRSSVINVMLTTAARHLKRIERVYEVRKLVGFNGYYGDQQVAFEEKTEALAQAKIDAYAFEELSK